MKDIFNQNKKLELGLEFLLFVLAFSIPFSSAFNSITIAVLFLYSFLWILKKKKFYLEKKKRYIFIFLLFFCIQLIGITYAKNTYLAVKSVSQNLAFLLLPIAFINLSNTIDKRKAQLAIYGLLVGVLVILLSAHFSMLNKIISENLDFKTIFSHFIRERFIENAIVSIHSPYFGLLTVFALIGSFKLNFSTNKRANKLLKLGLIIYLSFSIYEISAVMSIVLLAIFFSIQFFHLAKKGMVKKLFIVILLATLFFSIIFIFTDTSDTKRGSETIFNRMEMIINNGDHTRKENWKSVVAVIKEHMMFGVGSDGGLEQVQKLRDKKSEPYINAHNAHNQYLEYFLRFGLVGLSIFLFLIVKLAKQAFVSKNYFFSWFMIVFLIASLTESLLQRQIGIVFFTFFASLFLVFQDKKQTSVKKNT